jgi:hypothetical protein
MDRIYLNGYTEERLEQEDCVRKLLDRKLQTKFNKSVKAFKYWQKAQSRWAIIAFLGLPEIALASLLNLTGYVLIVIIAQMVIGCYKIFYAGRQMQRYEGPLIDMDV